MTQKQKRFVDEYLFDLNATQAAIRASYSAESARSIGSALLKKPEVRAHIDKAMAERSKRTGITKIALYGSWHGSRCSMRQM